MNGERKKVLEMLAAGKITADDAEKLLAKLAESKEPSPPQAGVPKQPGPLKYLRVVVDDADGDAVNIGVPIGLVRTGLKLSTMMPIGVIERLRQEGIDFSEFGALKGEELIEALRELQVNVDATDGSKVRIFCE